MSNKIRIPAEWEEHRAIWTCWPSDKELWLEDIEPARAEIAAMIKALITPHNGKFDKVKLLVSGEEAFASARAALPEAVEIFDIPFGDIWLRDTGPIFAKDGDNNIALCFGFNGWGGKYVLDHDDEVNGKLANAALVQSENIEMVLEGGSIDGNGQGVFLTTTQCLLNKNRNPQLSKADIETLFVENLGMTQMIWLGDGLLNDHTDGHIDNIARFISERTIICQSPVDNDPNQEVLDKIYNDLCAVRDEFGNGFEIIRAPSPGKVTDEDGKIIPASHMNFIIGNGSVVMPHYGTPSADAALKVLAECFPNHKIIGIKAEAVLTGGGSFHCITQQEPL